MPFGYLIGPGGDPNNYEMAAMDSEDANLIAYGEAIGASMLAAPTNSELHDYYTTVPSARDRVPQETNMGFWDEIRDRIEDAAIDFGEDVLTDVLDPSPGPTYLEPTTAPQTPTLRVQSGNACAMYPGYHLRKNPRLPGKCVRNRKMNSLNPNALRRATRRIAGFYGHVKSTEKHVRQALSHALPHRPANRRGGCGYCGQSKRSCKCG